MSEPDWAARDKLLKHWRGPSRIRGARPNRCSEGIMHQSTLEARRCDELHLLQQGGLIRDLEAHPQHRYDLGVNGVHVGAYLADFVYFDLERGETMVEDTKGWLDERARLKFKLMEACKGITVQIVRHSRGWRSAGMRG